MSQLNTKEILKHIVDLRRSDWDKERTDRKKGRYFFNRDANGVEKKVYVKNTDYYDGAIRPDYVFQFIGYAEQDPLSGFGYWQMHYGAEFVLETDDYWPEPLKPDAEGKYKFIDSVLVKVPTEVWVDKVVADRGKYDKTAKNLHESFSEQMKAVGGGLKDSDVF